MPKEISQERKEQSAFLLGMSAIALLYDYLPFSVYMIMAVGLLLFHTGLYYLKRKDFSLLNGITSLFFILIISAAIYKKLLFDIYQDSLTA